MDLSAVLGGLHTSPEELALVLGLPEDSLSNATQPPCPVAQRRLRDFVEVALAVAPWAGSMSLAFAWFAHQRLPSLGNETAASLLRKGRVELVQAHVSRIAVGGYA